MDAISMKILNTSKKMYFIIILISLKTSAQKFNFGPMFTTFQEKTFGIESDNDITVVHNTQQRKYRARFGIFFDYQITDRLSATTNIQYSEPLNKIGVDIHKYLTNEGYTKILVFSDKRLNSEMLLNFNVNNIESKLKIMLVAGLDFNYRLSFVDNTIKFEDPRDLEYEVLLNQAGSSYKKSFLRNTFGLKAEYNKIIFQMNYSYSPPRKSIANGFSYQNSYIYNHVTNNSLNFSAAYKLR
jgi:hypothetical protein